MHFVSSRVRKSLIALLFVVSTGIACFFAGQASARQPHMADALEHLRAAKRSLEAADADKGGHRAKALALVNDAIAEVNEGMQYDRRH